MNSKKNTTMYAENRKVSKSRGLERWKMIAMFLMLYDIVAINASFFVGLWLRFDLKYSSIPEAYRGAFLRFAPIYTVITIIIFYVLHLYKSLWIFASYSELLRVTIATALSFVVQCVGITIWYQRMPISYYIVGILLQFILTLGVRFFYRFVTLERARRAKHREKVNRILLIGAGKAGRMILRDVRNTPEANGEVCCFIDDNSNKWGRFIDGVEIVGGRDSIMEAVEKYEIDQIFLTIPSASAETKRDILNICKETGCQMKNLPGMYQLMTGQVSVGAMKEVAVEDLLGRDPIRVDLDEIFQYIKEKCVMVTGAGGSIGSEISTQIAGHEPKRLILFDFYENTTYELERKLRRLFPELDLVVLIGSVRDSLRICQVFEKYKPDIVYHAAAHKHVPLMEGSPCEAIKNNAVGTYKTAYAAMLNGCQRFVLISTDKAVNPTNIMGASKRLCEMIVQTFDRMIKHGRAHELPMLYAHDEDENGTMHRLQKRQYIPKTEFVAVRFGNVLGSNGSVIPLFKQQIANGGPVTVTHPDIIRYFMTIPEAVSLVLSAGVNAGGGEIFVLDMGSPMKIDTLARNLIKLSGMRPDVDIEIEYTGLRPGEKLYEEKLMEEEGMQKTKNELIHIGRPIPFDMDLFLKQLTGLMRASFENREDIREMVESIVPTYHPAGEHGCMEKGEVYRAQEEMMKIAENAKSV